MCNDSFELQSIDAKCIVKVGLSMSVKLMVTGEDGSAATRRKLIVRNLQIERNDCAYQAFYTRSNHSTYDVNEGSGEEISSGQIMTLKMA
ncbi:hypothetical protein ACH3XW_0105 [Acanthocheilonema viteae]